MLMIPVEVLALSVSPTCGDTCGGARGDRDTLCFCDGVCVHNEDCCVDYPAACLGKETLC